MAGETEDHPSSPDEPETRQVSVRVEAALVERFIAARRICEANGKELPIAEVVRLGMEAAIREVEATFGEAVEKQAPSRGEARRTSPGA
ncbi:MAG: hypothetical protein ACU0E9_10820 [Limimaricola soesokkakensis]|uniref:Uncharacterized protein n=1 Tax=Limimaricola soesokkakensis TaxID=1343159 RepID=A0A1X6ZVU2_9RHOB|nr:hypothetical protein [Limimaricola soesokkakensis]PSK81348.1 hypothetical protein CLV79_1162 [Limimaricola soesokkakensis]SLN62591.1 hypothetical protein LOS8367_03051 [Limimaricola soesokkakensis]